MSSPPPVDQASRPTDFRPALPPRPVARASSRRKPVPALSPFETGDESSEDSHRAIQPLASAVGTAPAPPSLPSRHIFQLDANPPTSEKPAHVHHVIRPFKEKKSWTIIPRSRRVRRWCWIITALLAILVIIIIAVVAFFVTRNSKTSTPSGSNHGGHPLTIKDGGVDIGKPGDIAKYGGGSTDHFVIQVNRSSLVTRLDPIVSPGKLSSHVHRFYGSSFVDENLHNASQMVNLAKCSTTAVQDDKSIYWVPQLYHRSLDNGTLTMVPIRYHAAYYFQKAPTGEPIHPFPDNFNIVAGNPFRREVESSDMSQRALWWQCFRGGGNDTTTPGFPTTGCSGGLIAIIQMPSCWDGIEAADGNYTPHVRYPTDAPNGYICPPDFPKKLMTVQFETNFAVGDLPFHGEEEVTWVLANGDTTGLGIHADFVNGWKPEVQQGIIDNCRYMNKTDAYSKPNDIHNCPALEPSISFAAAYSCRFQGQIVDEDVGANDWLELLPGCNALWSGTGDKPACPPGRQEGGELVKVDPQRWIEEEPYTK